MLIWLIFFFYATAPTEIYTYRHTLSLHDALPISRRGLRWRAAWPAGIVGESASLWRWLALQPRVAGIVGESAFALVMPGSSQCAAWPGTATAGAASKIGRAHV